MDFHQIFRYSVPTRETSYDCSPSSLLPNSDWKLRSVKHESESSPNSPLSYHLDCDTVSGLSSSQDHYSSTDNQSGFSPSNNLSFETESPCGQVCSNHAENLALHVSKKSTSHDGISRMQQALQELESALMDHESDEGSSPSSVVGETQKARSSKQQQQSKVYEREYSQEFTVSQPQPSSSGKSRKSDKRLCMTDYTLREIPQNNIKLLLYGCASALSENRISDFDKLVQDARTAVSISGDPIQRLGAYMVEGLVAQKEASGTNIYRALRCKEPESQDLLSYMQILYEICPYFKFGYMAANGAIAEAFKNEDRVHIIDFQIAQGTQWVTLIQALAARPGGPPHFRITGIDDPMSKYARGSGLDAVGNRLAAMSERFKIPIEFHPMPVYAAEVTRDMLDIRAGEALAVNFTLQLHHTPDESVDVNNPRDGLLRMVKSLCPKVTTLVEQESNTNTTPFLMRFAETLDYYSAMFESIDVTLRRDSKERINVEQHCLARDIVNIIACEGKDRIERHELLGKWKSRLSMAGFQPYPLSSYVNSVIRSLLGSYSENYTLVEKDGAMLLGWKNRNLISASAWH